MGAFRLRLLTAQRGGEILNMRWRDIDLDTRWWVNPAEFAKDGLSHRVPLNAKAVTILEDLRDWLERRIQEINVLRAKKHLEPQVFSDWEAQERSVCARGQGEATRSSPSRSVSLRR